VLRRSTIANQSKRNGGRVVTKLVGWLLKKEELRKEMERMSHILTTIRLTIERVIEQFKAKLKTVLSSVRKLLGGKSNAEETGGNTKSRTKVR
jgi:hypothetical protein